MDYSYNPVYEYHIDLNTMNLYTEMVKECVLNNTDLPLSDDPKFQERNRFVKDLYNVLIDFNSSGINPCFKKVSI